MLVGIHQLHYLPWLRYFEKIHTSDVFIVLDNIQFNKNGWQNRNRVKGPAGPVLLTIPIVHRFAQRLDEVHIDDSVDWRRKHRGSIEQFYAKAPNFSEFCGEIAAFYDQPWDTLNAINRSMLEYFVGALGIQTPIRYSSDLDVAGVATERLINLVRSVGGTEYYSGADALDTYLDADALKRAGIRMIIQEWKAPVYPQRYGGFEPDLSIVDLLMNCGPDALDVLTGKLTAHER